MDTDIDPATMCNRLSLVNIMWRDGREMAKGETVYARAFSFYIPGISGLAVEEYVPEVIHTYHVRLLMVVSKHHSSRLSMIMIKR